MVTCHSASSSTTTSPIRRQHTTTTTIQHPQNECPCAFSDFWPAPASAMKMMTLNRGEWGDGVCVTHPLQGMFSFNSINFLILFTITSHWGGAYSPPPSLHHRKRAHLCSFSMVGACLLPPPLVTIFTTPSPLKTSAHLLVFHLCQPLHHQKRVHLLIFDGGCYVPPPPPLHCWKQAHLLGFDGGCLFGASATPLLLETSVSACFFDGLPPPIPPPLSFPSISTSALIHWYFSTDLFTVSMCTGGLTPLPLFVSIFTSFCIYSI